MNQTEQVTSITGSDIDAAIQDERFIELERRIERLEGAAAQAGEAVVIVGAECLEQASRIEQLETCAVINAETIGHVAELRRTVAEQAERIEKLWHWAHEQ